MDIHRDEKSLKGSRNQLTLAAVLAILIPIIFPVVHILIFTQLWGHLTNPVDRSTCTCSCWDTVFKGPYESGIAKYKHVYFNSTWNVAKMWVITVLGVVLFYESFKQFFQLILSKKLRISMAVLFLSSLHSHYYAWWVHWNYWNDDFYELWSHQVFFSLSELASSAFVVYHLDRRKPIQPLAMLIVANIALFHVVTSASDQFFYSVILQHGRLHQVLRDILLMCTDILQSSVAIYELRKYTRQKGIAFCQLLTQKRHFVTVASATSLMYLIVFIFP